MDGMPTIPSPLRRCESNLAAYVNPWEVECRPNPVIFAHLSNSVEDTWKQNTSRGTNYDTNLAASSNCGDAIDTLCPDTSSFESLPDLHTPPTTVNPGGTLIGRRSIDAESSDDTVPTLESSTSEISADDIIPVTTSEESSPFKSKEWCLEKLGTVELINFAATVPANEPSSSIDDDVTVALSLSSHAWTNSGAIRSPSPATPLSSLTSVSTTAETSLNPSKSTEISTDMAFPCPLCHLSFRTSGLRRYVDLMHK